MMGVSSARPRQTEWENFQRRDTMAYWEGGQFPEVKRVIEKSDDVDIDSPGKYRLLFSCDYTTFWRGIEELAFHGFTMGQQDVAIIHRDLKERAGERHKSIQAVVKGVTRRISFMTTSLATTTILPGELIDLVVAYTCPILMNDQDFLVRSMGNHLISVETCNLIMKENVNVASFRELNLHEFFNRLERRGFEFSDFEKDRMRLCQATLTSRSFITDFLIF
jgi:hypothetical protein